MPTLGTNVERIQVSPTISNSIFLLSWELFQISAASPPLHRETGRGLQLLELQPFCQLVICLTVWPVPLPLVQRHFAQEESNKVNTRPMNSPIFKVPCSVPQNIHISGKHHGEPHICYLLLCWESKHLPPMRCFLKAQGHWAILSPLPWWASLTTWKYLKRLTLSVPYCLKNKNTLNL